jgi:serine/threonine-protein kinase RsbW
MAKSSPNGWRSVVLPSDPAAIPPFQQAIEAALAAIKVSKHDRFAIQLSLEEALVNAVKHGNRCDPNKKVHVRYAIRPDAFEIEIRDEGPGYRPDAVPDPLAAENMERPGGRGLLLMKHYMTEVAIDPPGNTLSMKRRYEALD